MKNILLTILGGILISVGVAYFAGPVDQFYFRSLFLLGLTFYITLVSYFVLSLRQLWIKILVAMLAGGVLGYFIGPVYAEYLKPIGDIFLNLIKMIIVLLVLSSMTVGISNIHDPKKLGRVGMKTLFFYFVMTVISIGLGLLFASYFGLGQEMGYTMPNEITITQDSRSVLDILISIIPVNPMASLVSGNILQTIVFALFLGVAINFAGERGKPLMELMESLADVMYTLTSIVMELTPIAVFAIMGWTVGTFGGENLQETLDKVLFPLLKFLLLYYFVCFLHFCVVYCGLLRFVARLHPKYFLKGMVNAIMVAFGTCSSSATLPESMHCVQENLGVSKNISSFVLPLGATVNMCGAAIYQAMAAIFVANAYGIHLEIAAIASIVITATLSAVGAAGVPGSGYIALSAVLSAAGLPIQGVMILLSIDRLREMVSAVLNILGDAVVAVTVAKQEGELDERQYYNEVLMEFEGSEA